MQWYLTTICIALPHYREVGRDRELCWRSFDRKFPPIALPLKSASSGFLSFSACNCVVVFMRVCGYVSVYVCVCMCEREREIERERERERERE